MSDIIEFRHLEYLVAIAERKNFSKAAEHVLRSQPAVSHQIKMVEADMSAERAQEQARSRDFLNDSQRRVIEEVLNSTDRIHGLQGRAGLEPHT